MVCRRRSTRATSTKRSSRCATCTPESSTSTRPRSARKCICRSAARSRPATDIARPALRASMCSASGNRFMSTTPASCSALKSIRRRSDDRRHSHPADCQAGPGSGLQDDRGRRQSGGEDRPRRARALFLLGAMQARIREESEKVPLMRFARCRLSVLGCLAVAVVAQAQTADDIIKRELATAQAYDNLEYLSDNIGPRLSGSTNAAAAVRWATGTFQKWGIPVTNEKVMVPHWVRGAEYGRLVSHRNQAIVLTALGGSVATPAKGITADVVEVSSFDELKTTDVKGKIVFYNNPMDMDMVRAHRSFEAYNKAVVFRGSGANRAAEYGAVAALIRSVGSASLRTPHTGAMRYDPKLPKIPAAAMTVEDAMLIDRLLKKGERVTMRLVLTPQTLPEVMSANVVAEIRGSEKPDEIVL